jgi:protein-tyrosine phosphatase
MIHVLFVCLGNICRSPAAEAIFARQVREAGLQDRIRCDSCGTGDYHLGESPDARMTRHLRGRGYPVDHRARQFRPQDDFSRFTLLVTMDGRNHADLLALASDPESAGRVVRMTDFCRELSAPEIPDPYYGGEDGFARVIDLLEDACAGLLAHLRETHFSDAP